MSLLRYVETAEFQIQNPLFRVGTNVDNTYTDNQDIGFFGQYYNGSNVVYTGLFRDASDSGKYKLFKELQPLPVVTDGSAIVNTAGAGYALADLDIQNLHAFGDVIVEGNFTVNGTTTTINVETLTVEDNIIIANGGPTNQKEDAGFVVKRIPANIAVGTAKQSGTASAAGTTTAITLQASNGHGTTLNYYKGWIIKLGGDLTGSFTVTSSTTANPPVLTFTPAASGSTTTSTTYELFNKQYVGMIYDESTDYTTFYGFPREDLAAVIDPAGNAGDGNLADYVNIRANDVDAKNNISAAGSITATGNITTTSGNLQVTTGNATIGGNLTVSGSILAPLNIDDNILAVNAGPTILAEDFGFVGKRTAANVGAQDTPKLNNVVINTNYTSGSTTLIINNAATGANYFSGWIVGNSVNSEFRTINSSTESSGVHTLTLSSGFTTNLTAGTNTVRLYNKRYTGFIYDESKDSLTALGFPRELNETVIDVAAPVNGNVPDYINLAVGDLTVNGSFNFSGSLANNTLTQITATTFTQSQLFNYNVIFLNPTGGNTTYTLPQISTLTISTNKAYIVLFVNIHATNRATIQRGGSDNIEGTTTLNLNKQWTKTVLVVSDTLATTWLIKG